MVETKRITAAVLVVGDEILSGRTKDKNIGTIADYCTDLGIDLCEVRVVSDEMDAIVNAVKALSSAYRYVFTTGGIGPTHDDITADAVSKAFGAELVINDEARKILEDRFGTVDVSPERLRMARIPVGGTLIANSVSGAPGFRLENVHVMAGVPKIMQAMLEAILPTLETGTKMISRSVPCGVGESVVSAGLGEIQAAYPDLKLGSYPQLGKRPMFTELVVRGADKSQVDEAFAKVEALVAALHEENGVEI